MIIKINKNKHETAELLALILTSRADIENMANFQRVRRILPKMHEIKARAFMYVMQKRNRLCKYN